MENIAYVVKKYNSVRILLIIIASLVMGLLVGAGSRSQFVAFSGNSASIAAPAASKSLSAASSQPSSNLAPANSTATLDKALRSMSSSNNAAKNRNDEAAVKAAGGTNVSVSSDNKASGSTSSNQASQTNGK